MLSVINCNQAAMCCMSCSRLGKVPRTKRPAVRARDVGRNIAQYNFPHARHGHIDYIWPLNYNHDLKSHTTYGHDSYKPTWKKSRSKFTRFIIQSGNKQTDGKTDETICIIAQQMLVFTPGYGVGVQVTAAEWHQLQCPCHQLSQPVALEPLGTRGHVPLHFGKRLGTEKHTEGAGATHRGLIWWTARKANSYISTHYFWPFVSLSLSSSSRCPLPAISPYKGSTVHPRMFFFKLHVPVDEFCDILVNRCLNPRTIFLYAI